jgi:hypothetical protein
MSATGCKNDRAPPELLLDGSPVTRPTVELEGIDPPVIATKVDRVPASDIESCLGPNRADAVRRRAVGRVGVLGASVTVPTAHRNALYACDASSRSLRPGVAWCGHVYGRVRNGRLIDPRLDMTCLDDEGNPVAFVWIEPSDDTRFVAVQQPGYVEVYEAAERLPIRVTTTDVAEQESTAAVEVSEHDRRGVLLRAYTLEAQVTG